jgi:DNA-binding response OmpR family regulator
MDRLKVLQVEDSLSYQVLFSHLSKEILDLHLVTSVNEVKALSKESLADIKLIILDGQLPDGTGMEVLMWLEENQLSIPVVANSSSNEYNRHMMDLGAKWSFNKSQVPKEIKEVLAKITQVANSSLK